MLSEYFALAEFRIEEGRGKTHSGLKLLEEWLRSFRYFFWPKTH